MKTVLIATWLLGFLVNAVLHRIQTNQFGDIAFPVVLAVLTAAIAAFQYHKVRGNRHGTNQLDVQV